MASAARTVSQVDGPGHLLRPLQHRVYRGGEFGFVVGHPSRHQLAPVAVEDDEVVVVSLPGVDPGPRLVDLLHALLRRSMMGSPSTCSPSVPYAAIDVADLNQRSRRRGAPGGQSGEAIAGRKLRAMPGAPWLPGPYDWPDDQEGREN